MLLLLLKIQNQAWFQSKCTQKAIQPLVGARPHRSLAFLGLMSICCVFHDEQILVTGRGKPANHGLHCAGPTAGPRGVLPGGAGRERDSPSLVPCCFSRSSARPPCPGCCALMGLYGAAPSCNRDFPRAGPRAHGAGHTRVIRTACRRAGCLRCPHLGSALAPPGQWTLLTAPADVSPSPPPGVPQHWKKGEHA